MTKDSVTTKSEALTEADRSQTRGRVASVTAGETATQTTLAHREKKDVLPIRGWKNLWFRNDGVSRNGKNVFPTEEAAREYAESFDREKFPHVVYAIQFPWRE